MNNLCIDTQDSLLRRKTELRLQYLASHISYVYHRLLCQSLSVTIVLKPIYILSNGPQQFNDSCTSNTVLRISLLEAGVPNSETLDHYWGTAFRVKDSPVSPE